MKVLQPARPQRGWATEATCTGAGNGNGGCGALLLVEEGDLFETTLSCMGETEYHVTFACGACGVLNDIRGVPSSVTMTLKPRTPGKCGRCGAPYAPDGSCSRRAVGCQGGRGESGA